jgi:aspartate aminotransferase-like enzyme
LDKEDSTFLSLFTPGPVDISDEARDAAARPVLHHRSSSFKQVLAGLIESLKSAFKTRDRVAVITSSGTGGMEAAVTGLLSPGEAVLVPVGGKFSARWAEICMAYGVEVHPIDLEPGQPPEAGQIIESLSRSPAIRTVLLTHCETSTGSLTDVQAVAEAVVDFERSEGRTILTCVDCISSLCVDEFRKDDWHIDCAVAASQKGLLAPPGLAFVSLSDRALARIAESVLPRYYLDLSKYFEGGAEAPFTPAVSLVCAARDSLDAVLRLGLERVWRACRSSATAVTLVMEAAGFRPVAEARSSAVTAFWADGVSPEAVSRILRDKHRIMVAAGQRELKGRTLRVSAIGKAPAEVIAFAEAVEAAMAEVGRPFSLNDIRDDLNRILEDSSIWE